MENGMLSTVSHLNLVTLNCFGVPLVQNTRARLTTLARELDREPVDVVCLQEVQFAAYVPLLDQHFSRFPFKAYEPFLYAPKGGLLTFSRQPIHEISFTLYSERGWWHTPSVADWLLHKGVLVTEIMQAGQPIIILNTHLTANYDGDWSPTNRYARLEHAQLCELAAIVNELDAHSLVVVAGDFNIPRHGWLYDEFVAATDLIDPLAGNTQPTYYPVVGLPDRFAQSIDHIFVRTPAGYAMTVSAELVFEHAVRLISGSVGRVSDHMGIRLHLQWQPDSGQAVPELAESLPMHSELSYPEYNHQCA
jgi:endonuclease/exonuclease/phosphatase family metal-dependent hydrolase